MAWQRRSVRLQPLTLGILLPTIILAIATPAAVAQVLPGWDFSVSGFVGSATPFDTDAKRTLGEQTWYEPIKEDTSIVFGGKLAAWTSAFRQTTGLDFGTEVDVSYFQPIDEPRSTLCPPGTCSLSPIVCALETTSTIAAINLLVRWPIDVSETFPNGWLQPYLGLGGGAVLARASAEFAGTFSLAASRQSWVRASDTDIAPALQLLAGAKVFFARHLAFFAEYNFSHAVHTFSFKGDSSRPSDHITLDVNHIVTGLAFHF